MKGCKNLSFPCKPWSCQILCEGSNPSVFSTFMGYTMIPFSKTMNPKRHHDLKKNINLWGLKRIRSKWNLSNTILIWIGWSTLLWERVARYLDKHWLYAWGHGMRRPWKIEKFLQHFEGWNASPGMKMFPKEKWMSSYVFSQVWFAFDYNLKIHT